MKSKRTARSQETRVLVETELKVGRERAVLEIGVLDLGGLLLEEVLCLDFTVLRVSVTDVDVELNTRTGTRCERDQSLVAYHGLG